MQVAQRQIGIPAAIVLAGLMVLAGAVVLWSCGKKGSPKPPTRSYPPGVDDLTYRISENTLELSWRNPTPNEEARLPVTGFLVYRSQQSSLEAPCPNCPIRYQIIGDVPVRGAGSGQIGAPAIIFTETLETGYRYIYKVHGYSKGGIRSKASNLVEFTF
jgi:hypothetical protein